MSSLSPSLDDLVDALKRLPGLGPRSASRIAEHLLSEDRARAEKLLGSLERAVKTVKHCELCNTRFVLFVPTAPVTAQRSAWWRAPLISAS